jgi:hypothetical protein
LGKTLWFERDRSGSDRDPRGYDRTPNVSGKNSQSLGLTTPVQLTAPYRSDPDRDSELTLSLVNKYRGPPLDVRVLVLPTNLANPRGSACPAPTVDAGMLARCSPFPAPRESFVRVHWWRVTFVPIRARCCSSEPHRAAIGPMVTAEVGPSVLSALRTPAFALMSR